MESETIKAFQNLQAFSDKELQQFKAVCNALLSRTFVVRTKYERGKGRISNPDYTFLSAHFPTVRAYL